MNQIVIFIYKTNLNHYKLIVYHSRLDYVMFIQQKFCTVYGDTDNELFIKW
jgi:hypothetical protein